MNLRNLRVSALPPGLLEAAWLFVMLRIGLSVLGLFVFSKGVPGPCHFEVALNGWLTIPPLANTQLEHPLIGIWQRWDACWYSKIATFGYEVGEDSTAFFPAWPFLMRLGALAFGGNVALGGLVMASLAFITALAGLHRLVDRDFDGELARRTLLFVTVAPAALFFIAPFTESLFLAATVWSVVAARERRWGLAILTGAVAGVTRLQGVFVVLPIAWEAFCAWRESPGGLRRLPDLRSLVAIAAPAATFVAFVVFTKITVGTTPFDSQDVWGGRNFHWPWETLEAGVGWMLDKGDAVTAVNIVALLLSIVAVVAGIRALPLAYTLLAAPQVLLIAIRIQPTPLTSIVRYVDVIFPVFVVLALWLDGRRREQAWATISALLMGALTWLFVKGDFVA